MNDQTVAYFSIEIAVDPAIRGISSGRAIKP